jgi:acetyl-CoA C-acetyltransferase
VAPLADRTPVLVGVGAISRRCEDPATAPEPLALMIEALEQAADDAGSRALLARADRICAPRGFWDYPDPCRAIAERFGAASAKTEVHEIGIPQTALFGRAAAAIAAGEADVVLVAAAEARHRAQRAAQLGVRAPLTRLPAGQADTVVRPDGLILTAPEVRAGLVQPVIQYAMIENAMRAADGQSIEKHREEVAALWAGFARVAAGNPDAWHRDGPDAAAILDTARNPMQAFPYGRWHCSQWNVDQAAGLVFTSAGTARALGVPREKWVFPLAVADSQFMLPLTERRAPARCAGFTATSRRALDHAGLRIEAIRHRELYSCFPIAVRLQLRALDIADDVPPTVTGGMRFAGGPLNHFTLQALTKLAERLRADAGGHGYLSAVSGIVTKQGASVWSSAEPERPFAFDDVSDDTQRETHSIEFIENAEGAGSIAAYTVLFDESGPTKTVLLVDLDDGRRTLVLDPDASLAATGQREELCGRALRVAAGRATLR